MSSLKRDYLRHKVIDLLLRRAAPPPELDGVEVLKARGRGLKLKVDTDRVGIGEVVGALLERYPVEDISIADPPLEDTIALIYRGGDAAPAARGGTGHGAG